MRLNIRTKLFLGFGAVLALMTVASLLALSNINNVSDGSATINDDVLPNTEVLGSLKSDAQAWRNEQFEFVAADDADEKDAAAKQLTSGTAVIKGHFDRLARDLGDDPEEKKQLATVRGQWDEYVKQSAGAIAASRAGETDEAVDVLLTTGDKLFSPFAASLDDWRKDEHGEGAEVYDAAEATTSSART